MTQLKQAIQSLAKKNTGFDATVELATVKAVNQLTATCDVVLFDNPDLELFNVKLKPTVADLATDQGAIVYPSVGSKVLIGQINDSPADLFVIATSKVDKVSLDAGSLFKMAMDMQGGGMALDLASMVFNGGKNGGMVKVKPLLDKINQLEKKVNALIEDFKAHKHGGVASGAGVTLIPDKQTLAKIAENTKLEEIENTVITM